MSCNAAQVTVGQVNWLAPTGVLGLHPIASLGPVSVGPGSTEASWAHLPEVRVSIDPLKTLAQRKVVLKVQAPGAEVGCTLHLLEHQHLDYKTVHTGVAKPSPEAAACLAVSSQDAQA